MLDCKKTSYEHIVVKPAEANTQSYRSFYKLNKFDSLSSCIGIQKQGIQTHPHYILLIIRKKQRNYPQ